MMVKVWQKEQEFMVDETILNAGDFMRSKRFSSIYRLEDGVAFELYWAEFDHNDIKRETVGQHVNKVRLNND